MRASDTESLGSPMPRSAKLWSNTLKLSDPSSVAIAGAVVVVDDVVLDAAVVAAVDRDAPLELRLDRAAVDGVPEHRELVAVGRRRQRAAEVMHVDRVAADVVGGRVQRQVGRAAQVLEERVADVDVGHVDREHVAAGAGGALRADDDVPGQVADVRQKIEHAVQIARAEVVVLQRAVERQRPAVRRNRLHRALFPLVDGVDPAAAGHFAFLDVPRVGQDEPVADLPSRDRFRQRQRRVAGARLGREAHEGRRLHAAVHRRLCRARSMPVPNWSVSETLPPSGELAMTISAVTLAAIGVAACRLRGRPACPSPCCRP